MLSILFSYRDSLPLISSDIYLPINPQHIGVDSKGGDRVFIKDLSTVFFYVFLKFCYPVLVIVT